MYNYRNYLQNITSTYPISASCTPSSHHTWSTARVHMHVPKTLVLSISTQLAMLPSNSEPSLRDIPALFISTSMPSPGQRFATILGNVAT